MTTPAEIPALVPSITGNPGLDSVIRSGLIAASSAITAVIWTWLNARGFTDPNINLMISGAILAALLALAGAIWGWIKGTQVGQVIASKELVAVQAGMAAMAAHAEVRPGEAPPVITAAHAQAIITTFAPKPSPAGTAADDLNASELARVTNRT